MTDAEEALLRMAMLLHIILFHMENQLDVTQFREDICAHLTRADELVRVPK